MKCLDLFSGTHSVANALKERGHEVVTLDLKDSDINKNILEWEYWKDYPKGYFDYIHGSPPCDTFSLCRKCWIGRKLKSTRRRNIYERIIFRRSIKYWCPYIT